MKRSYLTYIIKANRRGTNNHRNMWSKSFKIDGIVLSYGTTEICDANHSKLIPWYFITKNPNTGKIKVFVAQSLKPYKIAEILSSRALKLKILTGHANIARVKFYHVGDLVEKSEEICTICKIVYNSNKVQRSLKKVRQVPIDKVGGKQVGSHIKYRRYRWRHKYAQEKKRDQFGEIRIDAIHFRP